MATCYKEDKQFETETSSVVSDGGALHRALKSSLVKSGGTMRHNSEVPGSRQKLWRSASLSLVCCLVAVTFTACSSGSSSSSSGTTSTAALGKPNAATGSTVNVGLIADTGGGTAGTGALVEQGAKAAVQFANAYRGGLNGHKINLVVCENQNTPAGGQNCANQMVQQGVVAVVLPFTGQGQTEVPTITGAGIPYITLSGASTAELTTKGSFALGGGFPAILGGFALYAKEHNLKKVAFIVSNVPAAIQGTQIFGGLVFKNAGVGFQAIPANVGSADLTPELQSAVSGGASAIGIVGDVTLCSSFFSAYKTLSLTQPRFVISTCIDPSITNSSLEEVLKGSQVGAGNNISAADQALYGALVTKYAPGVNPNPNLSTGQLGGVQPVFALLSIMQGYTGAVTAASVLQQTETRQNVLLPFSGGLTFTCNGKAIPLLSSVCSALSVIGVMGSGSTILNKKVYDTTPLFTG